MYFHPKIFLGVPYNHIFKEWHFRRKMLWKNIEKVSLLENKVFHLNFTLNFDSGKLTYPRKMRGIIFLFFDRDEIQDFSIFLTYLGLKEFPGTNLQLGNLKCVI
jgi:hypothetical protein